MSTNFPTSLDSYTTKNSGDTISEGHVNDLQDAVVAAETKLGVNSTAVNTAIDYFLKHASGAYRTHVHDAGSDDGPNIPEVNIDFDTSAGHDHDGNDSKLISTYLAGQSVQVVNTQTGAVATGTTAIPDDDTIPVQSPVAEGDQYMSLAITPTSATNKLKIDVVIFLGHTNAGMMVTALFQDTTANALACGSAALDTGGANRMECIKFTHYMTAGTTSATTFKVRAGHSAGATTTFNGYSSGRSYGGVLVSSITISEIKV